MRAALAAMALAAAACGGRGAPVAPPTTAPPAPAPSIDVVFVERPARDVAWAPITDEARLARLRGQLDNEAARLALALYALAWELSPPPAPAAPTLYIGVEAGGNHAEVGLRLADGVTYDDLPYLRLADDAETFRGTLLHETGHAVHGLLARGAAGLDAIGIAPIPHSTAAITDRRTAFAEGFGIHLEAVLGHCGREPATRAFYDHAPLPHGPTGDRASEYYFGARDVMTYAQTFARYQAVRDGAYAFEPAARGDYLRVQLDPARELRTLRDPGSLMASEGFVASVLFHVVAAAGCPDALVELAPRYRDLLVALRAAEARTPPAAAPLLALVAEAGEPAIRAFLDLSRGVTVDAEAAGLWARLYDAAIAVELEARDALLAELEPRRARWLAEAVADPTTLGRRVGPVVPVEVPAVAVGIALFGPPQPLTFDANAAGAAMLGLVPGWSADDVARVLAAREAAPFADLADLRARLGAAGVATTMLAPPATGS